MRRKRSTFYVVRTNNYYWVPTLHQWMISIPRKYDASNGRYVKTYKRALGIGQALCVTTRQEVIITQWAWRHGKRVYRDILLTYNP
jgi:hypothetical protein